MNDLSTFLTTWSDAERDGDAATTDHLLTDDFVGIGPVGFQLPKAAWLQRQTGGDLHYDSLGLDEVTTRFTTWAGAGRAVGIGIRREGRA